MNKIRKEQVVEELNQAFRANRNVLLINFTGVNVADITELRRKVAQAGSQYRVIKNTLAVRAARDTAVAQLTDYFEGPTAVALSKEDPVQVVRILTDFVKAHPSMSFKVGVLDETVLSAEQIEQLATLPSREELLAKLIYLMRSPLARLAGALQTPLRNLASGLKQLESVKGKGQ